MSNIRSFEDCDCRRYRRGYKIPRDPGYPAMAWGGYLPGDEPGNYCSETDCSCEPGANIDLEDCPRMELTTLRDPELEVGEDSKESPIWRDKETGELYFFELGDWFDLRSFQKMHVEKIKELLRDRVEEYKASIANGSFRKQAAVECLQDDLDQIQKAVSETYASIPEIISMKVNDGSVS